MAQVHFVEDYERYVARLMKRQPLGRSVAILRKP